MSVLPLALPSMRSLLDDDAIFAKQLYEFTNEGTLGFNIKRQLDRRFLFFTKNQHHLINAWMLCAKLTKRGQ